MTLTSRDVRGRRFGLPSTSNLFSYPKINAQNNISDEKNKLLCYTDVGTYLVGNSTQFYVKVFRIGTNETIFDTTNNLFIFSDKYMRISIFFMKKNKYLSKIFKVQQCQLDIFLAWGKEVRNSFS